MDPCKAKFLKFCCWRGFHLAFFDEGDDSKPPVFLLHGFSSSVRVNWFFTGWVKFLREAGFRVVALDNLGHGESDKPADPACYSLALMAADAVSLLVYLGIHTAHVMGYSMGARIALSMALFYPLHVRSLVLGGVGSGLYDKEVMDWRPVIDSLLLPSSEEIRHPLGLMFRKFAEQTSPKNDLSILAACLSMTCKLFNFRDIQRVDVPGLIAVGSKDEIAGSSQSLGLLMPRSLVLDIPERDHMLAVGDKVFKQGVLDFYAGIKND